MVEYACGLYMQDQYSGKARLFIKVVIVAYNNSQGVSA
jgi:hypothetical protein